MIDLRSQHRINPWLTRFVSGKANECRRRPRRYQVDPWSRGGVVARGVLRSCPEAGKRSSSFVIQEGWTIFVVCFLYTSGQVFSYQTLSRRPPRITGRVVNTGTRGWVGATNERGLFRFRGAVVGVVDRCQSRTRNLTASNHSFG